MLKIQIKLVYNEHHFFSSSTVIHKETFAFLFQLQNLVLISNQRSVQKQLNRGKSFQFQILKLF